MQGSVLLEILSIASFALAGVFLILAIVMFFKLNIAQVVGYLTGTTAKKDIKRITSHNESEDEALSGVKTMTDDLKGKNQTKNRSGKTRKNKKPNQKSNETTALNQSNETTVLSDDNATTVLSNTDATTVLSENQTSQTESGETQILRNDDTVLLNTEKKDESFNVETNIILVHSDELIL